MSAIDPCSAGNEPEEVLLDAALSLRDVRVVMHSGADIVDEVSLAVRPGEVLGVVGESGSGKTTVGLAVMGHTRRGARLDGGFIVIDGEDVGGASEKQLIGLRGRLMAYIPQDPPAALNPVLRIGAQIEELLGAHADAFSPRERGTRLKQVLEEVALPSDEKFLRRYPHQLSGGQQQRVVIAMAFICRPRVLVCDEPTTGLDVTTQARVLETIRELSKRHQVATVYISHDLAVVSSLADRVAIMYAGRVVEWGEARDIFRAPQHPYTQGLLRATPDLEGHRLAVGIPGHAPAPSARPHGCTFAPRCHRRVERCTERFPPVGEIGASHRVRCYVPRTESFANDAATESAAPSGRGDVLVVRGLHAGYHGTPVLHGVDLDVGERECVAIVGESGSGKTTFARCVAGLHPPSNGELLLAGEPLVASARRRSDAQRRAIQYVFQNPYASLNPRQTVGQAVTTPIRRFFPERRREMSQLVAQMLERVALPASAAERFPDELSGGERQRVAIARALATQPMLLVCDEITSALDVSVQATILDMLRELQAEMGLALLFITHDLALIRNVAHRVVVIAEGEVVESGPTASTFAAPQAEYTRQLLANSANLELVGQ